MELVTQELRSHEGPIGPRGDGGERQGLPYQGLQNSKGGTRPRTGQHCGAGAAHVCCSKCAAAPQDHRLKRVFPKSEKAACGANRMEGDGELMLHPCPQARVRRTTCAHVGPSATLHASPCKASQTSQASQASKCLACHWQMMRFKQNRPSSKHTGGWEEQEVEHEADRGESSYRRLAQLQLVCLRHPGRTGARLEVFNSGQGRWLRAR